MELYNVHETCFLLYNSFAYRLSLIHMPVIYSFYAATAGTTAYRKTAFGMPATFRISFHYWNLCKVQLGSTLQTCQFIVSARRPILISNIIENSHLVYMLSYYEDKLHYGNAPFFTSYKTRRLQAFTRATSNDIA